MVAAGAVAKKWLREQFGTEVRGCMTQLGEVVIQHEGWDHVHQNPFFAANVSQIEELEAYMDALRKEGNSIGARLYVEATGVPVGLGEPLFDKLDADIAFAMMGINAVKGVEIGDGMRVAAMRGTEHRDEMTPQGFLSNHSGGVSGGISTGQDLVCSLAIKPTSSITTPGRSIDSDGKAVDMRTTGRHDPCVGVRATPIAEAMVALVLIDHLLRHRGQCADVVPGTPTIPGRVQP